MKNFVNKKLFIIAIVSIVIIFSGCTKKATVQIDNEQSQNNQTTEELKKQNEEQQRQISELQQYKEEQQRLGEEQNRQEGINSCKENQEYCKQRLSAIGIEKVELYNGKKEGLGWVEGDRNKAIEKEQEELKDNKKDLEKFTAENILEAAKKSIKIHEERIAAIKALIIKEQQEKSSLLTGKCANFKNSCE